MSHEKILDHFIFSLLKCRAMPLGLYSLLQQHEMSKYMTQYLVYWLQM